ncbi:MAG: rhodanese-like domain-containing protein [bacterium]|nr:rhodanese-like domain-containing protein [bacterium]
MKTRKTRTALSILAAIALSASGALATAKTETVLKTETSSSSSSTVVTEVKSEALYQELAVQDAKSFIDNHKDVVVIDVSTRYEQGHLPGAVNYPISDGTFDKALDSLDKDKMYLVYCHGDRPSIAAAEKLKEAGFNHVYRLVGNYQAWVDAGYAVEK